MNLLSAPPILSRLASRLRRARLIRRNTPTRHHVGRFSEGEEVLPDSPEKQHRGRFSEGQEELGEEDPEKHIHGRVSTGEDAGRPGIVP
jgi:hypothetical protein